MLFHWRRSPFYVQEPFTDAPGDPAGGGGGGNPDEGTAHPDYDVDFGDGAVGDDPPQPPVPGAPAVPPVQDPARPAGGVPGQEPRTPAIDPAVFQTLQQTVTQSQGQIQTLVAENRRLMQTIGALTGREPGPAAPAGDQQPQLSEADQRAVSAIHRLFPGLKTLLDKAPELLQMPDSVKAFHQGEQSRWTDIGNRMWTTFDGEVRKAFALAEGAQMNPFAQKALDSAFVSWLETDQNAAARYRMGDTTLATEFMKNYLNGVIVPAHRARQQPPPAPGAPGAPQPGQPGARRPAAPPPRVPRGGPGSPPVTQQPAQPNVRNADEIHSAAADAFFTQR